MSIISMQNQVKKINCYRQNAQNYFFFRKTDGGHFVFLATFNLTIIVIIIITIVSKIYRIKVAVNTTCGTCKIHKSKMAVEYKQTFKPG